MTKKILGLLSSKMLFVESVLQGKIKLNDFDFLFICIALIFI